MKFNIRLLYLYLFSFIGLAVIVGSTISLVDLGLRVLVFKDADTYNYYYAPRLEKPENDITEEQAMENAIKERTSARQRDLSNSIAMLAVGVPLYAYHWRLIKKENQDYKNQSY